MRSAIAIASVVLVVGLPRAGHADAVTDCAKIQGKAYAAYSASIINAAARACGKGSTAAPAAVSQAAIGSAAAKFYAVVGKTVDQFGPASCLFTLRNLNDAAIHADVETVLDLAVSAAGRGCLVPEVP